MSEYTNELPDEHERAHTEKSTDKKCPACEGVMDFDPATGGLLCPYCGHWEEIKVTHGTKKEAVMEQDFFAAVNRESFDWGAEKKTVYCQACGVGLVYDALQNSDICPYCGSNQVIQSEDEDTMKPGGVVPFKVTDKQASELFVGWIKRKWFCPNEAKRVAKAEKFKGIYLPFWTYDTNTYSTYTGQYGKERRVRVNKDETKVVIDWYNTSGKYDTFINDHTVLASKTHDTNMINKLLPYDTEANKAYEPQFVAGFVSERYAIGLEEGWGIAKPEIIREIKSDIRSKIENEHSTNHVRNVQVDTRFENLKYKYLLLPIWNSYFKYNGKVYNFMVNGQTGEVAGKYPISPIKVAIAVVLGILAAIAIGYLILFN